MKKKFMRGIAAFLAVVMMLPTSALAENTMPEGNGANNEPAVVGTESNDSTEEIVLKILNGEKDVTNGTIALSSTGSNSTATLTIDKGYDVDWSSNKKSVVTVEGGKLTAKGVGTATITVQYEGKEVTCTVEVTARTLDKISVDGNPKNTYVTGESFSFGDARVVATYSDSSTEIVTSKCKVSPSEDLRKADTSVTVSYEEGDVKKSIDVPITVKDDTIKGIKIVSPSSGTKYKVGETIARSSVSIEVSYEVGKPVTLNAEDYSEITISPSGKLAKTDKQLTVSYGGESDAILISVEEEKTETTEKELTVTATITKYPTKMNYVAGEKFNVAGMKILYTFSGKDSDKYTSYEQELQGTSQTALTAGKTSYSFTVTENQTGKKVNITVDGITVAASSTPAVNVQKLNDSTSGNYKYAFRSDAEISVGDTLDWTDIFKYIHIQYKDGSTTKYQKITDNADLKAFLGDNAKLHLVVSDRYNESDGDEIEASDVKNGKVTLRLYLEYSGNNVTYTATTKSIVFSMEVSDVAATVTIYRNSSSSYTTGISKVFDDLEDALDSLEDEDDLISDYQISSTYENNFAVKIKLGEDQDIEGYTFEPDHEHTITIDLNGNKLTLDSEWIEYKTKNEEIEIVITNTNDDDDGTLYYDDLRETIPVAEGSELKFTEGNIPTDTDAALTVKIYKNSSTTSSPIKTKVYEELDDLLNDLKKQTTALETFDIDDDYEDDFVARIQFGEDEDQDISGYTFAPDYDATIFIDLNGNKLTLDTDWIDYDSDNNGLSVKINNTNTDNATLVYDDENITVTVKKNATALEFKEDQIPGIYDISIGSMTNGKATMSKDTVGHGGSVKFTITPNSGYAIDTVKINSKTVSTSSYTVDSKGVGTYELKDITADSKLDVTFKKASSTTTEKEEDKTTTSTTNWTNPFTDVSKNAQYYDAVAFVCSEGLFNGMTATKFEPTTTMTRAMFVTVLGRLAGVDANRYSGTSFTDVSKTDQQISWAAPYIEWAVQNGITQGTGNGKFSPNDPITHQQMYLFMYRYAMFIENITTNITNVSLSGIKDASQIADWAQDGVKFASRNNILITSGGKLTPADNALRCELAMLLQGFCTKVLGYNG